MPSRSNKGRHANMLVKASLIKQYLKKANVHILSANSSKLQLNSLENTDCLVFINTVTSKKYWEDNIIAKIFRLRHSNAKKIRELSRFLIMGV